eukprot:64204_1
MAEDAEQPSPQDLKKAISSMRNADKQSDMALNYALKDNEETNKKLSAMAKNNDTLMAKIHKIGDRLAADPQERSEKVKQRKEARLQKRIERQYQKTQQLINFWTKKFIQHIETNNIYDNKIRNDDETLQQIEQKLIKYGINTDELFKNRKQTPIDPNSIDMKKLKEIANNTDIQSDEDEEQQLENLKHIPDYIINNSPKHNETENKSVENKNEIKLMNVDINEFNFKPSHHTYPGLSDVKPVSLLPTYEPVKMVAEPVQDMDIHNNEMESKPLRDVNKYCNLEYNGGNNSLYPSMKGLGPKINFKKYEPMKPKNMKIKSDKDMDIDKDMHDDDLLDELDDINGMGHIIQSENKKIGCVQNELVDDNGNDDDLLDDLDDVEVPLNMYQVSDDKHDKNSNNDKDVNVGRMNGQVQYNQQYNQQYVQQNNMNQYGRGYVMNNQYRQGMYPIQNYHNVNNNMYYNNNNYYRPQIQQMNNNNQTMVNNNNNKIQSNNYPNIYNMKKPEYKMQKK